MHILDDIQRRSKSNQKNAYSSYQISSASEHNCDSHRAFLSKFLNGAARPVDRRYKVPSASAGSNANSDLKTTAKRNSKPRAIRSKRVASSKQASIPAILFPSCRGEKKPKKHRSNQTEDNRRNKCGEYSRRYRTEDSQVEDTSLSEQSWLPDDPVEIIPDTEDGFPSPSAKKPTFVAMIKTAIRDLKKYRQTTVEAISKYIILRYKFENDILLQYLLDWMTDMRILERRGENYVFSSQRLVKKTTVAYIQDRRSRTSRRRKKSKRRSRSRKRKSSRGRRKSKRRRYELRDYGKSRKPQCARKKVKRAHRNDFPQCRKPCTCKKELRAAKNRVKVKSRYVRRGGKIYKEEEYI